MAVSEPHHSTLLKWGTPTPLQLEDPQYGLVVPVSAFGQMGVRIADAGQFAGSLMGTLRSAMVINPARRVS